MSEQPKDYSKLPRRDADEKDSFLIAIFFAALFGTLIGLVVGLAIGSNA